MPVSKSSKIEWVSCDKCSRWEMFENCTVELGIDKYDEVKINETNFKCRLCKTDEKLACFMEQSENKFAGVVSRITKLEEALKNEESNKRQGEFLGRIMKVEEKGKHIEETKRSVQETEQKIVNTDCK